MVSTAKWTTSDSTVPTRVGVLDVAPRIWAASLSKRETSCLVDRMIRLESTATRADLKRLSSVAAMESVRILLKVAEAKMAHSQNDPEWQEFMCTMKCGDAWRLRRAWAEVVTYWPAVELVQILGGDTVESLNALLTTNSKTDA